MEKKIFTYIPWLYKNFWIYKGFLVWPKIFLAKVLQALIFTHLYAAEKNACSIPECEHCINYILNTHKYYRIGKKRGC